jgi:hypothetical protein
MMRKIMILCLALVAGGCATQSETGSDAESAATGGGVSKVLTSLALPLKPKLSAAELLGKDAEWVRHKLGEPSFARADLHANIWQYKNKICILNLFLYSNAKQRQPLTLLHFDARDVYGHGTDREACLGTFQVN